MDARPDPAPEPTRTEIDGVRTVWADAPGLLTAGLMFRVGRADETMPRLGSSHLVEHLALWPSRRLEHPFNGWVEDAVTGFHCSGTPEEVVAFLAATTAALRALPLDRLDVERRVLVAEASARRPSVFAHHRSARFGPQGYGLCDQYEFAIDWLPASDIEAWSASHFTRENAVLWLSGPPPADLRLDLPSGSASAPPAPGDGIPQLVLPAHQDLDQGGVSLSLVGDRTAAMHLALGVLVDRAVDELRQTTGASYAPDGAYDVLDGRHVQLLVQADCRRPDAPEVLDALLRSLDGLAEHGPTDDEMARDRRRLTEWLTEPEATMTRLDWHARNELLGLPAETAGALLSEREALTPDAVATEVRACLPSLLTVAAVPVGRVGRDGMSAYERPAPAERSGRIYVTTKQWRGFNIDMTIALDEEGLTYRQRYTEKGAPTNPPVTFRFDDIVAAPRIPSGGLAIVDRTGEYLTVHPERFVDGPELLQQLLDAVGPDRVIPLAEIEARVADAVAADLGPVDSAALGGEIDLVPRLLGEQEALELMCAVKRGDQAGLVVLTDRRMVYLFCGPRGTDLVDVPRDGTATAALKGALRKRLTVTHDGTTTVLEQFRPASGQDQVLRAIAG